MFAYLGMEGGGMIESRMRPGSGERSRDPRHFLSWGRATGQEGTPQGQCSDPVPSPHGSSEQGAAGEGDLTTGLRRERATGVLLFSST